MDFYFLISLCFCFSFTWFFMNVALTFVTVYLADRLFKGNAQPHEIYIASMIYSIVYLGCAIILNYNLHYDFNHFLFYAYSFIVFRIIWVLIWTVILRKHL